MIQIFKRIRKNLVNEGKTTKYFKYAIGEIALVVIGILIALQLNTWKQERQQQTQLNSIYKTIKEDLKTDTLQLSSVIKTLKEKDEWLRKIVNDEFPKSYYDTINAENYIDCDFCRSPITNYNAIRMQNKGYNLLKNINNQSQIKNDTLSSHIVEFYATIENVIPNQIDRIKSITGKNIEYFQQFPWFLDWINYKYNKDNLDYFLNDEDYKKKAAIYFIYSTFNYLRMLEDYKEGATEILNAIDKKFPEESIND